MSGKSVKLNKRIIKRQAKKFYAKGNNDVLDFQYECNLWGRIKIAMSIVFKIK